MTQHTIRADAVRVGDRIYHAPGPHWQSVLDIIVRDDGWVVLHTSGVTTWRHPAEGIAVRRKEATHEDR